VFFRSDKSWTIFNGLPLAYQILTAGIQRMSQENQIAAPLRLLSRGDAAILENAKYD
jgi:hypothetical protein